MNQGGLDTFGARQLQQRLHDGLGQCLSLAIIQLDDAAAAPGAGGLPRARALLQEAMLEVRSLIGSLEPPATTSRPEADLPNRLSALVRQINGQQATPVTFTTDGTPPRAPEHVCEILVGATRELLVNACKHGPAQSVDASLSSLPHRLSITVTQHPGVGHAAPTPPPGLGLGLGATRERLSLIGARLRWRSGAACGVQARIRWVPPR